jgi:hypothetical protein
MQILGHRYTMVLCCIIQIIGVVRRSPFFLFHLLELISLPYSVELSTYTTTQYAVGRFIIYIAVGVVENVVP